jgi:hypothetical protein
LNLPNINNAIKIHKNFMLIIVYCYKKTSPKSSPKERTFQNSFKLLNSMQIKVLSFGEDLGEVKRQQRMLTGGMQIAPYLVYLRIRVGGL